MAVLTGPVAHDLRRWTSRSLALLDTTPSPSPCTPALSDAALSTPPCTLLRCLPLRRPPPYFHHRCCCRLSRRGEREGEQQRGEGGGEDKECTLLAFPPPFPDLPLPSPLFHPRRCCCDMRKRRKRTIRSRRRGRVRNARCLPFLSPRFQRCR